MTVETGCSTVCCRIRAAQIAPHCYMLSLAYRAEPYACGVHAYTRAATQLQAHKRSLLASTACAHTTWSEPPQHCAACHLACAAVCAGFSPMMSKRLLGQLTLALVVSAGTFIARHDAYTCVSRLQWLRSPLWGSAVVQAWCKCCRVAPQQVGQGWPQMTRERLQMMKLLWTLRLVLLSFADASCHGPAGGQGGHQSVCDRICATTWGHSCLKDFVSRYAGCEGGGEPKLECTEVTSKDPCTWPAVA